MTTSRRSRESAYADLLASLVDLRDDTATEQFDALLAQAVTEGLIDPELAKGLRWWQRESLRAQSDHLKLVGGQALAALAASTDDSRASTVAAAQSWERATAAPDPEPTAQVAQPAPEAVAEAAPDATEPVESASVPDHIDLDAARAASRVATSPTATASVVVETSADEVESATPDAASARRRRLLVAGLTVLTDGD